MDTTHRQITKIAREASKFTVRILKVDGIGPSEYDFIHVVRKNPGITQAGVRAVLGIDKGACARRTASLEQKGYLVRRADPGDHRSRQLFATEKSEHLKRSKEAIETVYYAWLLEDLSREDRATFARILDTLYQKNKTESKSGFLQVTRRLQDSFPAREENGL